ncbi:MAG: PAS domain S-box protein [Desulfurivibrionaceae bacterium]
MKKLLEAVNPLSALARKNNQRPYDQLEKEVEELRRQNREMTEHLHEAQFFGDLIDASNDAVYMVDPAAGRFLEVNKQACKLLGYSREELLNMDVFDVDCNIKTPEDWQSHIQQLKAEKSVILESLHQTRSGDTFPVEINTKLIERDSESFVVGIARDIRERRRIEDNLIEEKNKLEGILAALGDGLTVQDTNFKILYQNHVHRRKQGDHLGEYCYRAYQNRTGICEGCLLVKCFADGQVRRRETSATTENGVIHMEVSASPVRDAYGNIVAGVETIRDITDRKSLEAQLVQAQKMEAVGRLTSGIAHDFNNLLSTIMGYSDLMLMDIAEGEIPDMEKSKKELEAIHEAGEKATTLTRQLLAFSRKQALELQVVDLNQIIENITRVLSRLIGEDINLELNLQPGLGNIKADPGQIEQILMNLTINARDAMPQGGSLYIESGRITIDEEYANRHEGITPGPYAALIITDTGEGILKEDQPNIFDPFFTTKPTGKGTGLGLATVHGIVKQHGGHVFVYSEPGKGTTFKIMFRETAGEAEEYGQSEQTAVTLQGKEKILVVDDESAIRKLVLDILRPLGFELLEAGSGEEALNICREMEEPPALLLTDLIMTDMDGRKLAEQLSSLHPEIKIIFMSGYTDNIIVEGGELKAGVNYLAKPIIPSDLISKLKNVLGRP